MEHKKNTQDEDDRWMLSKVYKKPVQNHESISTGVINIQENTIRKLTKHIRKDYPH